MRFRNLQPLFFQLWAIRMISIDGIMPAFDVEIAIVANSQKRMDDLRPIRISKTGEAMLGDSGVANAILREQRPVDMRILRVNMENTGAELF